MFNMEQHLHLILPVILPVAAGGAMLAGKPLKENKRAGRVVLLLALGLELLLVAQALMKGGPGQTEHCQLPTGRGRSRS